MKKNAKTFLIALPLAIAMFLTACSVSNTENPVTTSLESVTPPQPQAETSASFESTPAEIQSETTEQSQSSILEEGTDERYNLQAAIEAYEYDSITFFDGTVVSKNDAVWGYLDESTFSNMLSFDLAFMRYAQSIYQDTDIDPSLFDFDGFEQTVASLWTNIENPEYFKVTPGQILDNGLAVKETSCMVSYVDKSTGIAHIGENHIALDGSISVEGILFCCKDDEYINAAGDMLFYPNPVKGDHIPMPYKDYETTFGGVDLNNKFAFSSDGGRLLVGNIYTSNLDLSDYFEDNEYVKVKATLTDIVLSFNESGGGNVSTAVLADVELSE